MRTFLTNIFKNSFLAVSAIAFIMTTTSCKQNVGQFYSLEEAYEKHLINRNDLLNIAYYWNREENINDSDFVHTEISMDDLDEETIVAIKNTSLKVLDNVYGIKNGSIDHVFIEKYCGTYNGNVAIGLKTDYAAIDPITYPDYQIDGVHFLYFNLSLIHGMQIWSKSKA